MVLTILVGTDYTRINLKFAPFSFFSFPTFESNSFRYNINYQKTSDSLPC